MKKNLEKKLKKNLEKNLEKILTEIAVFHLKFYYLFIDFCILWPLCQKAQVKTDKKMTTTVYRNNFKKYRYLKNKGFQINLNCKSRLWKDACSFLFDT